MLRSDAGASKQALAGIQRLCCVGIGGELLMPDLMRGLIPSRHGIFYWVVPNFEIANTYSIFPPAIIKFFSGISS
jgi:hypothetical protein